jgi:sporulation protein YlmC with PRC-barrel domain
MKSDRNAQSRTPMAMATIRDEFYMNSRLVSTGARRLLTFLAVLSMLVLLLIASSPTAVHSQTTQIVTVDVAVVGKGFRVSKLTGHEVVNEKNENVGKIDDLVIGRESAHPVFAVLQVGGFLGIGSRLVAVPFNSLKIDDSLRRVELPGASRDELKRLTEFKYAS